MQSPTDKLIDQIERIPNIAAHRFHTRTVPLRLKGLDHDAVSGLAFFAKAMLDFPTGGGHTDIYDALSRRLREFTGALFSGVVVYNQQNSIGYVRSVASSKQDMDKVVDLLRGELIGLRVPYSKEFIGRLRAQPVMRIEDGVSGLLKGIICADRAQEITTALGIGECYMFAMCYQDQLLGTGHIVLPQGGSLLPGQKVTIATVAHMFAISLHHHLVEEAYAQTQHQLQDSHDRYTQLFNQAGAAILVMDGPVILDANAQTMDIFGFRPEELIGRNLLETLSAIRPNRPELPSLVRKKIEDTLAGHEQTFEINFNWFGGVRLTAEARMIPVQFQGRTIIQAIVRDISERKTTEKALKESEARYRELFTGSRDGILTTDMLGRIIDVNPAYLQLLGYDQREDLLNKPLWELVPPDYRSLEAELEEKLMAEGDTGEYEVELYRSDGSRVLVRKRRWLSRDEQGKPVARWSIVRDITHLRRMENEVGAVEKFRLLGELAATISHEVRNPLTTVRGFLQYFMSENQYRPQDQEYFKLMISELDSATTIIGDFLDMARPTGPKRQVLSISQLLSSVIRVMASKGIVQKVEVIPYISDGLAIMGDPTQIREVFVNIIQNAFQAMPNGGKLTISAFQQEDTAVIAISDTGYGIPEESLDRLGRPFFTTKPGGTGLGLSACYRIVNNHQGRIAVTSEVGRGTTFKVFLPVL